jgi:hypothetical protein
VTLSGNRNEDPLAGRRSVALVLRVVFDAHGVVLYGEVVDAVARSATERFAGWEGLVATLRRCLTRAAAGPAEGGVP